MKGKPLVWMLMPLLLAALYGCPKKKVQTAEQAVAPQTETVTSPPPTEVAPSPVAPTDDQVEDGLLSSDLQVVNDELRRRGFSPDVYFAYDEDTLSDEARDKLARNAEDVASLAKSMLGMMLKTHQTGPEGRKVKLSPKPPLVGTQTLEKIIAHNPDYESRIKNYAPDEAAVTFLSQYKQKTQIQIYFGSWCSVCEAWVPRLVKSVQSAKNPVLEMQFEALPKNFLSDTTAKVKGITGVPTIILVQNEKEIGRLNGRPEEGTMEAAIAKLLRTNAP